MKYTHLLLPALLVISSIANATPVRTLLFGGTIYSGDAATPHPEAVGIEGDKIIAVGSFEEVSRQLGDGAERVDLKGRYLMPGLIDTHAHAAFAGFQSMTVNLPVGLTQASQIRKFITQNHDDPRLMQGDVLLLSNVSLDYWSELSLLDNVFNAAPYDKVPVVLAGSDAHTGWVNNAMLKRAAGSLKSHSNLGGSMSRDGHQKLNGFVSEGDWDFILQNIPPVSDATIASAIELAAAQLNQVGITAWMDPISNIRPLAPIFSAHPDRRSEGLLPAYTKLAKDGKLNGHVSALALVGIDSQPSIIDDVLAIQKKFNGAQDLDVKVVGIKILQDGVIEFPSQTAKLSQDYLNRPGYRGKENLTVDRFNELVRRADANNLIVHFHAIGDRAVDEALDAIAYARQKNDNSGVLHSITHLEIVSPNSIARFKPLGVAASMQLLWARKDASSTFLIEGKVPASLLLNLYPAGSLLKHGVVLAGASDWPVSSPNPFLAMYTALTRQGELGELPPASERVTRKAILQAYTLNAARVIGRESKIGSLSVAKSADMVLLDRNIEMVSVDQLKETQVIWTMFKGRRVFEAPLSVIEIK
ncbi:amidohydrolase [Pseudomonas aeruginosa]|uniref:amidohydrolase n=1 Tax=Pseudomonas aeruginosa TaxID=287 RepID=UPI000BB577D9|nr:amidohydrolase [Pseudomonas aeruginosa]PBM99982.1 amidohydrolase [Pseudomonas aeruginosa]